MKSIFVSIPSYRDSELIHTLKDLFTKSSNQYSIQPYVLLQEESSSLTTSLQDLQEVFKDKINIIPTDIKNSRGPCWARHWLQQFITHQEYYLQLDSHHRFIENWDLRMVEHLSMCPPKSLLTCYPAPYEPPNTILPHHVPTKLKATGFDVNGMLNIEGSELILSASQPVEGNLMAGGFIFAPIEFTREVPYDPELYFKGEEVSMSVRAWTNGWNIYHPHETLLYHYYTRTNNKKHWDDSKTWSEMDRTSVNRIKTLLEMEHIHPHVYLGIYDLGNKRSLSQYETTYGIRFKERALITT